MAHAEKSRRNSPRKGMVSVRDWRVEGLQDALVTGELDPGLFRPIGDSPEKRQAKIVRFLEILRGAIGAR